MKIKKWTVKDIVEDFNNHQDYELHSSYTFIAIDDLLEWIKGYETSLGDLPKELSELKEESNQHNKKD